MLAALCCDYYVSVCVGRLCACQEQAFNAINPSPDAFSFSPMCMGAGNCSAKLTHVPLCLSCLVHVEQPAHSLLGNPSCRSKRCTHGRFEQEPQQRVEVALRGFNGRISSCSRAHAYDSMPSCQDASGQLRYNQQCASPWPCAPPKVSAICARCGWGLSMLHRMQQTGTYCCMCICAPMCRCMHMSEPSLALRFTLCGLSDVLSVTCSACMPITKHPGHGSSNGCGVLPSHPNVACTPLHVPAV